MTQSKTFNFFREGAPDFANVLKAEHQHFIYQLAIASVERGTNRRGGTAIGTVVRRTLEIRGRGLLPDPRPAVVYAYAKQPTCPSPSTA